MRMKPLLSLLVSFLLPSAFCFLTPVQVHVTPARGNTVLTGIRGFRAWFESQFPDALTTIQKGHKTPEKFDHVLIDVNQILHVCVRKSRSDGHALTLLMKELDEIVQLSTPTTSLVLALDGSPSAAKLSTQRKRRFATVTKSEWQVRNLDKVGKRMKAAALARKKLKAQSEVRCLTLTPGTDMMRLAEQAILYWAWQRLDGRSALLENVKIFVSPSVRFCCLLVYKNVVSHSPLLFSRITTDRRWRRRSETLGMDLPSTTAWGVYPLVGRRLGSSPRRTRHPSVEYAQCPCLATGW
jgi:hypothetical protein